MGTAGGVRSAQPSAPGSAGRPRRPSAASGRPSSSPPSSPSDRRSSARPAVHLRRLRWLRHLDPRLVRRAPGRSGQGPPRVGPGRESAVGDRNPGQRIDPARRDGHRGRRLRRALGRDRRTQRGVGRQRGPGRLRPAGRVAGHGRHDPRPDGWLVAGCGGRRVGRRDHVAPPTGRSPSVGRGGQRHGTGRRARGRRGRAARPRRAAPGGRRQARRCWPRSPPRRTGRPASPCRTRPSATWSSRSNGAPTWWATPRPTASAWRNGTASTPRSYRAAAEVLRSIGSLVLGAGEPDPWPAVEELERLRVEAMHHAQVRSRHGADPDVVHQSWHCGTIAVSVRTAALDTLIASRRADPAVVARPRRAWLGDEEWSHRREGSRVGGRRGGRGEASGAAGGGGGGPPPRQHPLGLDPQQRSGRRSPSPRRSPWPT